MPLPPASVRPALARCRWPRWKFGTVSVRSSGGVERDGDDHRTHPAPHVVRGALRVPARTADERPARRSNARRRAAKRATSCPARRRGPRPAAGPCERADTPSARDDAFHERTRRRDDRVDRRQRRDEVDGSPLSRERARLGVERCPAVARSDDAEAREPPGHQLGEVVVAHDRRDRAAEDRRVDGDARAADRADLDQPAAAVCPVLTPITPG